MAGKYRSTRTGEPYHSSPNQLANLKRVQTDYWDKLTPEERKAKRLENAAKSHESHRRNKSMQRMAQEILNMPLISEDDFRDELVRRGFSKSDATETAAVLLAQLRKARAGDTDAARFLRDTSGQKPADNLAIGNMDDKPFESMDLSKMSTEQLAALVEDGEDE